MTDNSGIGTAVAGINPIEVVDNPDEGQVKCPACLWRTTTTYTASGDGEGICTTCLVELHQGESLVLSEKAISQLVDDEKLSSTEEKAAFVDALVEQIEA